MEKPYIGASDGLSPDYSNQSQQHLKLLKHSTVKFTLPVYIIDQTVSRLIRVIFLALLFSRPPNQSRRIFSDSNMPSRVYVSKHCMSHQQRFGLVDPGL